MHQNIKATIHVSGLMLHQFELLFAGSTRENPNAALKPASVSEEYKQEVREQALKKSKGLPSLLTFNSYKNLKYYTRKGKHCPDNSFRMVHKIWHRLNYDPLEQYRACWNPWTWE